MAMTKSKMLTVMVEPEFQERVRRKTEETGIPYSEVLRRALEVWLETGELPKLPKSTKRKRSPIE
jgi:hypothetical protein